jgi:hypothetical protein
VNGLKGFFDGNREARLAQPGDSYKVGVSILGRDPPPKRHPAQAGHREQAAIPRRLRRVSGQVAVGATVVDEVFYFREEVHGFMRGSVPIEGEIAAALFR